MITPESQLLVIDQEPLLGAARGALEVAYREIALLKAELERHETRDLPAYARWAQVTFAALRAEGRRLVEFLAEREQFLSRLREVHWARFFGTAEGQPHFETGMGRDENETRAFCELHARWQGAQRPDDDEGEGEYGPEHEERRFEKARPAFDDEEESHYAEDEDSARRFEEMFSSERSSPGRASWSPRANRGERREPGATAARADTLTESELAALRLKDAYRTLVRQLHPDLNPDLSDDEKGMWNRVQAAYEKESLEELELLLALSSIFSGRILRSGSLAEIRRANREVERMLAPLRDKLAEARKSRAWKFSERSELTGLRLAVEKDHRQELAELRQKLARVETLIRRFE